MTEHRQKIRGTEIQLDQEVATEGLLAYSIDGHNLRVYDGTTLGGYTILNADQIAALYTLPTRLASPSIGMSGGSASANQANASGWFTTDAAVTDQPVAEAATIFAIKSPDNGVTQTWISKVDATEYTRRRNAAGVWSTWQRHVTASYLTGSAVAYDSTRLGGQLPAYYTAIAARLGYTPVNKAGDTITGALTVGGTLTANGNAAVGGTLAVAGQIAVAGNQLSVAGANPRIYLQDTTAGAHDFFVYADGSQFYVLTDRNDDGNYETPHPLNLRNSDGNGFLYGNLIITAADMGPGNGFNADMVDGQHASAFAVVGRTITAGNGLTGGGDLSANRTVALGAGSTLTATTTNSVGATTHAHDLDVVNIVSVGNQGLGATAVGGYVFASKKNGSGASLDLDDTISGSLLEAANAGSGRGAGLSGTYRCCGYHAGSSTIATLFKRI